MQTAAVNVNRRFWSSQAGYVLALLVLVSFPFVLGWLTRSDPLGRRGLSVFWQGVVIEVLILTILTMSYNLIFGFTGVVSFGHALFFGVGAYILGGFLRTGQFGEAGLIVGVVAGMATCAVIGVLVGLVSLRLRGVYFAMFTLAVAQMVFIFIGRYAETGGEDGFTLNGIPLWLDATRSRLTLYYVAVALFVLTFVFIRRLISSPTGAVLLGIRENESRAQTIGYNTLKFKLLAISLAGMLAALAGMLSAILNKKVGPDMLSVDYTVNPLLMTIIGGVGTFSGPVIGAAGLRLSNQLLRDARLSIGDTVLRIGESWTLILGVCFVLTVIVFPQGISQLWLPRPGKKRQGLRLRLRTILRSHSPESDVR
jgi:branched-chain amino acid transport system permease protein